MYSPEGSNLVSVRTKYEKCRNVQKVKCNWSFGRKPQPTRWTLHVVVNFYITSLPLHKHIYIYIHETRMGHRKTYCPQKSTFGQVFLANRFMKRPVAASGLLSPPFRKVEQWKKGWSYPALVRDLEKVVSINSGPGKIKSHVRKPYRKRRTIITTNLDRWAEYECGWDRKQSNR